MSTIARRLSQQQTPFKCEVKLRFTGRICFGFRTNTNTRTWGSGGWPLTNRSFFLFVVWSADTLAKDRIYFPEVFSIFFIFSLPFYETLHHVCYKSPAGINQSINQDFSNHFKYVHTYIPCREQVVLMSPSKSRCKTTTIHSIRDGGNQFQFQWIFDE